MGIMTSIITQGNGFIAYDCGAPAANMTTLSLVDIQKCDIPITKPQTTKTKIQLIQTVEHSHIRVIQCKVEIQRSIYYCGRSSHISTVSNGHMQYIEETSRAFCEDIHRTSTHHMYNTVITDIPANSTVTRAITLTGSADNKGNCEVGQFSDHYGTWKNVVVQGQVFITVQDYLAPVNFMKNEITLRSGIRCAYSTENCMDIEGGNTYWEIIKRDACELDRFRVIYEGNALKVKDNSVKDYGEEIYTVTTNQITFALSVRGFIPSCGHKLIKTEHPKLFIVDSPDSNFFIEKTALTPTDMDIFAYVNSKVVYLEKHLKKEIVTMYNDVIRQQCELEKLILHNSLALAALAPAEFAFHFMKEPGYMANIAGEVIRLIKCVPVEVQTRKTDECYQELPVTRGDEKFFMLPRTHLLVETGNQIDCSSFAPAMYNINNAWYQILPQLAPAISPQEIAPRTQMSWSYTSPSHLASSGIYSNSDLEKLRE
ncbi:uncharacterized protein LOC130677748 [Microplitis mediator]|uniref:uncharacterized protein LOC130677748 n=1 Tax=Microplitis mediator TaxID=375433 RepID=UPI002555FC2F|nr:uncharacterized protein LOC130677748 [Microplitis mediator]